MEHLRIAIDGPAGAGKSTVAKEVARRLGILYVDTGAMYRGVAWLSAEYSVEVADEDGLLQLLSDHQLTFAKGQSGGFEVSADGVAITHLLRSVEVSERVSELSAHPRVREILTERQRQLSHCESVVMDGRDIGTVVMPDADYKFFLTADLAERARRRHAELKAKGFHGSLEQLRETIATRDRRDSNRSIAPLVKASDAIEIDSTGKTVAEVCDEILRVVSRD